MINIFYVQQSASFIMFHSSKFKIEPMYIKLSIFKEQQQQQQKFEITLKDRVDFLIEIANILVDEILSGFQFSYLCSFIANRH